MTGELTIRRETPEDHGEAENLVREAFWDVYKPGCDEHLILHKLRGSPSFVGELDYVACDGDLIVGSIVYSEARIIDVNDKEYTALCMGPIAVLPSRQGQGIGSSLIRQSIDKARTLGYRAIVLFGSPAYYPRFRFRNAREYDIQTAQGENLDAFMALELYEKSLEEINGRFHADPVFQTGSDELESFDKSFPHKEKHVTDTQLR